MITIAGFNPTYYAGLGAIYSGKRVVPIPLFGGASQHLLDVVQRADFISNSSAYGQLDGPTGAVLVSKVLELAGVGRLPRVMVVHGRGDDRLTLADWLHERCEVVLMIEKVCRVKRCRRSMNGWHGTPTQRLRSPQPTTLPLWPRTR